MDNIDRFDTIETRNELATFLGIKISTLTYLLYIKRTENMYSSFYIPKKNGGFRRISAPYSQLKNIQRKLAAALWEHQKIIRTEFNAVINLSHAFEKNKGIITNAKIHRNKRFVLNIDLKDYFNSIHFGRVKGYFEKNRNYVLPTAIATILAQLTCFRGSLPQGAPSSPIITNLISQILDLRLFKIAKTYKLDYTRYADDLTFSTNNRKFSINYSDFLSEISDAISLAGFYINTEKTRLQYKDSCQKVTGLVVNKKLSVERCYIKNTRAMAYSLYSKGNFIINGEQGTLNQLEGRFAFISQIDNQYHSLSSMDHNRNAAQKGKQSFRHLTGREEQYRKFLFYKYFYANEKPMILTEGKTDIAYIKAALKNLYEHYPDLITKTPDGFIYHISFLKRSPRLSYLFGLFQDGADAMKNIYSFYIGGDHLPNYHEYFQNLCPPFIKSPVLFLFDNELNTPGKPLKSFTSFMKLNAANMENIKNNLQINLVDNLYLLTNPLVDGKAECEIEDLFTAETLSNKVNGKEFSLESNYDTSLYYGKEIFSKYVTNYYGNINFNRFKPLLDALVSIITTT